jgi:hypothetical protein
MAERTFLNWRYTWTRSKPETPSSHATSGVPQPGVKLRLWTDTVDKKEQHCYTVHQWGWAVSVAIDTPTMSLETANWQEGTALLHSTSLRISCFGYYTCSNNVTRQWVGKKEQRCYTVHQWGSAVSVAIVTPTKSRETANWQEGTALLRSAKIRTSCFGFCSYFSEQFA